MKYDHGSWRSGHGSQQKDGYQHSKDKSDHVYKHCQDKDSNGYHQVSPQHFLSAPAQVSGAYQSKSCAHSPSKKSPELQSPWFPDRGGSHIDIRRYDSDDEDEEVSTADTDYEQLVSQVIHRLEMLEAHPQTPPSDIPHHVQTADAYHRDTDPHFTPASPQAQAPASADCIMDREWDYWSIGAPRPRVYSMPSKRPPPLQHAFPRSSPPRGHGSIVVRSFAIQSGGRLNRGPTYVSETSLCPESEKSPPGYTKDKKLESSKCKEPTKYTVRIFGGSAVGKSAIINSFLQNGMVTQSSFTSSGRIHLL